MSVLRIGHRLVRDDRVSTHIGLVARAFGAQTVWFTGIADAVKPAVDDVTERFGGGFEIKLTRGWKQVINSWKDQGGLVIHLTMYGLRIGEVTDKIRRSGKNLLIVVGSKKVPGTLFSIADYNVAVGGQPHSEVAALAVFLDRFFEGEELKREFAHYKVRVIPERKGKRVEMVR